MDPDGAGRPGSFSAHLMAGSFLGFTNLIAPFDLEISVSWSAVMRFEMFEACLTICRDAQEW
jgi:hypothetical protein